MDTHLVLHGLIDPADQPGKGLSINGFSQSISHINGMIQCEWAENLYRKIKKIKNVFFVLKSMTKYECDDLDTLSALASIFLYVSPSWRI